MSKKGSPRYNHNKDYESNLAKIRVEEGFTIKQLAEVTGIHTQYIGMLQSGMLPPFYLLGKRKYMLRKGINKLTKVLNASLSDLFPRYICDIRRGDLVPEQILECTMGEQPSNRSVALKRNIFTALEHLGTRERAVIILRYLSEKTVDEVAYIFKVSTQRIRQIEAKALRKLRHSSRSRYLENYY